MMKNLRVPARPEFLESVRAYVLQMAAASGASDSVLFRIELAIEEALTNVFKYAYAEAGGELEIACFASSEPDRMITIEIRDWGIPFDPMLCEPPDISQDLMERPVGGLGIYLIRKIADRVVYCPLENGNQLALSFLVG
ncbi:MAG: ATP-binding protein [Syntrophobacteraceae bacterium]